MINKIKKLARRNPSYYKPLYALAFLKKHPKKFFKWILLPKNKKYAFMQEAEYEFNANKSIYDEKIEDYVVGSFSKQNNWKDYEEYLMKYINSSYKNKIALDFGTGPGRNIVKFFSKFKRIDGVDISKTNIKNAVNYLKKNNITNSKLFVNDGLSLNKIPSDYYDCVFSTICFQHICVYSTRFNLLKEIYRVLKKNGRISIQMGYGENSPKSVGYYEDFYWAASTNRGCDTRVENPNQIKKDLLKIGFKNFEYWMRPTGPGDLHPNWIFFTAVK